MIPTILLWGLIFGRWWRAALIAAAVVWPAILVVDGAMRLELGLVGAAVLAVANAAVGVGVHQGVLWLVRRLRPDPSAVPS